MAKELAKEKTTLKNLVTPPHDAETGVHDDHQASLRLWLRILSCTKVIESRIRQNLQAKFDTTLPRFDLMAQLDRTPERLTMSELSQRMMVTGGNVTGIADCLEKEGLIVRKVDTADRRVVRVELTADGKRQFQRMAAEHEQWVINLFERMSLKQKKQLSALLGDLKSHINRQKGG